MSIYRPYYTVKNTPEGELAGAQWWDHKWVLLLSLLLPYLFAIFPEPLTQMTKVSWLALLSCLLAVTAGIVVQSIHNRRGVVDDESRSIRQGTLRDVIRVARFNLGFSIFTAVAAHAFFFQHLPALYLVVEPESRTQTKAPFVDSYKLRLMKRSYNAEMSDFYHDYALGKVDDEDPMASINYLLTTLNYPASDADWKYKLKYEYATQGRYLVEPYLGGKIELDTYDHVGQRYIRKLVITALRDPGRDPSQNPSQPLRDAPSPAAPSEAPLSPPETTTPEGSQEGQSDIWFPDN